MPNILVYGWYHQGNIGDDFFIESFQYLFSNFDFTFTDHIDKDNLQNADAVFIGGGSFLESPINIDDSLLALLKTKKIFYFGVGVETNIHPIHIELMTLAKLIVTRSINQVSRIKLINLNALYVPDIVYALQHKVIMSPRKSKTILILPNANVVPSLKDAHWKHAAWGYFKSEFCQFLDWLIDSGYKLKFFPLCQAKEVHDVWVTAELISLMKYRNHEYISTNSAKNMTDVSKMISKYSGVITQRFHGIVLSEMTKTPYLAIHHHDKLKDCSPANGEFISYYNLSKQALIDSFISTMQIKFNSILPIDSHIFKDISNQVIGLI